MKFSYHVAQFVIYNRQCVYHTLEKASKSFQLHVLPFCSKCENFQTIIHMRNLTLRSVCNTFRPSTSTKVYTLLDLNYSIYLIYQYTTQIYVIYVILFLHTNSSYEQLLRIILAERPKDLYYCTNVYTWLLNTSDLIVSHIG